MSLLEPGFSVARIVIFLLGRFLSAWLTQAWAADAVPSLCTRATGFLWGLIMGYLAMCSRNKRRMERSSSPIRPIDCHRLARHFMGAIFLLRLARICLITRRRFFHNWGQH